MFVEEKEVGEVPATLDDASKLLLKAADLIEKHGWCQNDYRSEDGRLCIRGAILVADGVEDLRWVPHWGAAAIQADIRFHDAVGEVPAPWNDAPGRSKEEVVAKLRAVALGL